VSSIVGSLEMRMPRDRNRERERERCEKVLIRCVVKLFAYVLRDGVEVDVEKV